MVTVTPSAADKIRSLCAAEGKVPARLRLSVQPGGCTGFQYGMSLDAEPSQNDRLFDSGGVQVVVDDASVPYLSGSEVDYVDTLMKSSFEVRNPNATSTCACGQSFQVAGQEVAHRLH